MPVFVHPHTASRWLHRPIRWLYLLLCVSSTDATVESIRRTEYRDRAQQAHAFFLVVNFFQLFLFIFFYFHPSISYFSSIFTSTSTVLSSAWYFEISATYIPFAISRVIMCSNTDISVLLTMSVPYWSRHLTTLSLALLSTRRICPDRSWGQGLGHYRPCLAEQCEPPKDALATAPDPRWVLLINSAPAP